LPGDMLFDCQAMHRGTGNFSYISRFYPGKPCTFVG
jgi:hypothetical protein